MGDAREELAELAHVAEAARQAVHVQQLRVEAGRGDDGRVEPVARQRLAVVHLGVEQRARPLARLPIGVLDEAVALALTCQR